VNVHAKLSVKNENKVIANPKIMRLKNKSKIKKRISQIAQVISVRRSILFHPRI
jgi:hypothetical protein